MRISRRQLAISAIGVATLFAWYLTGDKSLREGSGSDTVNTALALDCTSRVAKSGAMFAVGDAVDTVGDIFGGPVGLPTPGALNSSSTSDLPIFINVTDPYDDSITVTSLGHVFHDDCSEGATAFKQSTPVTLTSSTPEVGAAGFMVALDATHADAGAASIDNSPGSSAEVSVSLSAAPSDATERPGAIFSANRAPELARTRTSFDYLPGENSLLPKGSGPGAVSAALPVDSTGSTKKSGTVFPVGPSFNSVGPTSSGMSQVRLTTPGVSNRSRIAGPRTVRNATKPAGDSITSKTVGRTIHDARGVDSTSNPTTPATLASTLPGITEAAFVGESIIVKGLGRTFHDERGDGSTTFNLSAPVTQVLNVSEMGEAGLVLDLEPAQTDAAAAFINNSRTSLTNVDGGSAAELNDATGGPGTFMSADRAPSLALSTVPAPANYFFANAAPTAEVSLVPEPATHVLILAGLGAVGFIARRRIR